MLLEGWHRVLLGRVQRRHDRLGADLHLVRVKELQQSQERGRFHVGQCDFFVLVGEVGVEHGVEDRGADGKDETMSGNSLLLTEI